MIFDTRLSEPDVWENCAEYALCCTKQRHVSELKQTNHQLILMSTCGIAPIQRMRIRLSAEQNRFKANQQLSIMSLGPQTVLCQY